MDDSLSLGDAGEISGTPAYMALEQIEGAGPAGDCSGSLPAARTARPS